MSSPPSSWIWSTSCLDLDEALCRGFLDDRRAVDMAVRRVQLLIEENMLPLTPADKEVLPLIREKEKDDWELMVDMMP